MKNLNKEMIIKALKRLKELCEEDQIKLELCIYGGVAMMLAYDQRAVTKDIDAIIKPKEKITPYIQSVSEELNLHSEWLNSDVYQFLSPVKNDKRKLEILSNETGIDIYIPTAKYLLAMKAMACRDPLPGYEGDHGDLKFLIKKLNIQSVSAIEEIVESYYPQEAFSPEKSLTLESLIKKSHE